MRSYKSRREALKAAKIERAYCIGSRADTIQAFVSETRHEPLRRYAPALRCPCCACVLAEARRGLGVRRDERPADTRLIPAHPPGALARLRLTRGEPVRPGKLPRALLLPRPHSCWLGAGIPAGTGFGNKRSIRVSGYVWRLWACCSDLRPDLGPGCTTSTIGTAPAGLSARDLVLYDLAYRCGPECCCSTGAVES